MEQPEESGDLSIPAQDHAREVLTTVEQKLRRAMVAERIASCDALLYTLHIERVLRRLREVAPDLIAAVEAEVAAFDPE